MFKDQFETAGIKFDTLKTRWDLLPLTMLKQIVDVLTFGAQKYSDDNWKMIPNAKARYFAAMMRHVEQWQSGEQKDEESGFNHLAHAGCCLLFMLWFDENEVARPKTTANQPVVNAEPTASAVTGMY